jgi:hypothetical protein
MVVGPIIALKMTRDLDERRETIRRKSEIFQALMKTRRFNLALEHVMALNLIQVEFYGNARIDNAYKIYINLLHRVAPKPDDPNVQKFFEEQEDALYDLLHEIGYELGYKYDKRDLKKLAYGPQGWLNDENAIRYLRHLAIEILAGKRAVPIVDASSLATTITSAATQSVNGLFPPPPGASN